MLSKISEIAHKFSNLSGVNVFSKSTEEIAHEVKTGKSTPSRMKFAAGRLSAGNGATKRLEENYLFDTRLFPVGALAVTDYVYFSSAIGQPGANNGFLGGLVMSELETNMNVPSQIAQGQNFVMTQVGVSFNANAQVGDIATLMEAGALRFTKQGSQFTLKHGPIRFWPGGTGLAGFASSGVIPTVNIGAHNGDADIRAVRRLTVPRVLKQKESFSYVYTVPRANSMVTDAANTLVAATLMTVWLWGAQQDNIPG